MTLTRRDLRTVVADSTPLTQDQLSVAVPAPQQQPDQTRPVTYTTPEGPTFLGTQPTAPFGEDPTDPTTWQTARVQPTGMVGRLHEAAAPAPAPKPKGGKK
jgi:hypothetical protein